MLSRGRSDLEYLALQVDALFEHDSDGRLVATNEPTPALAPRIFFGRTRGGNLWRVRSDLTAHTSSRVAALLDGESPSQDLHAPPASLSALCDVLRTDPTQATIVAGPAFRFPDTLLELPAASGTLVRRLVRPDIPLLVRMGWDSAEALERGFATWEPMCGAIVEGEAVSLCHSSRLTPRAAEAGVNTLAAYRGHGYAPAVVAAWARAVRASERVPLYSTAWANVASQAVARKLGLTEYGADWSLF